MTNTEAMKLALEALEAFLRFAAIHHDGPDTSDKYLAEDYAVEGFRKARQVLPALRTATEQQEPVAWAEEIITDLHALYDSEMITENDSGDALIRLDAAVCAVEEAAERHTNAPAADDLIATYEKGFNDCAAQRQPLPAHEIVTMYEENPTSDSDMIAFARTIEAAHGIGEKNT